MRIIDAHRVLGSVPTGPSHRTVQALLADLDAKGVDRAAVTRSWDLFGDERDRREYEAERADEGWPDRLIPVPVVVPEHPAYSRGLGVEHRDATMVRFAPSANFAPLGSDGRDLLAELAHAGTAVCLDVGSVGWEVAASISSSEKELKLLLLNPGYRSLPRLADLLGSRERIWVETGTLISAGSIEWLVERVGDRRLVFGTGAPLRDAGGPRFTLDHLELAESSRAAIASGNWERMTERDDR